MSSCRVVGLVSVVDGSDIYNHRHITHCWCPRVFVCLLGTRGRRLAGYGETDVDVSWLRSERNVCVSYRLTRQNQLAKKYAKQRPRKWLMQRGEDRGCRDCSWTKKETKDKLQALSSCSKRINTLSALSSSSVPPFSSSVDRWFWRGVLVGSQF